MDRPEIDPIDAAVAIDPAVAVSMSDADLGAALEHTEQQLIAAFDGNDVNTRSEVLAQARATSAAALEYIHTLRREERDLRHQANAARVITARREALAVLERKVRMFIFAADEPDRFNGLVQQGRGDVLDPNRRGSSIADLL